MDPPDESSPIWDMLAAWDGARREGQEPSPEELCRDRPELLQDLRDAIELLKATEWMDRPLTAPSTYSPFRLPTDLGGYTLLEEVGGGGQGHVFKARHRQMDRVVAVKILPVALAATPQAVVRFQQEVRLAAKLVHPNVVQAYDAGEQDGVPYLVMELVEGTDLERLLQRGGPLPVAKAAEFVRQAAAGLAYAHDKDVVHGDVKPSNLLLTAEGVVKVADLGLATARLSGGTETSHRDPAAGTPSFMAPEQADPTGRVDHRADIYGLGATLHFLLTGKPTYDGKTVLDWLKAQRDDATPSLREARPDVPPALNAIFQKMVARKPDDRFQSMADLLVALTPYCSAGRTGRPLLFTGGLLGLVLVVVVLGLAGWSMWGRPQPKDVVRETSQEDLRFDSQDEDFRGVAVSHDGKLVVTGGFNTGAARLWDAQTGKHLRTLGSFAGKVHAVAFSHDGKLVAAGGGDSDMIVVVWETQTGREVCRLTGHEGGVWDVKFLPDNRHLLSSSHDTTLRLWDIQSGKEVRKYEGHTRPAFKVAVSPDGEYALSGGADNHIIFWHIATGKILHDFRSHATAVWCVAISPDGRRGLSGDQAGIVRVWDLDQGREERKLLASTEAVFTAAWHPDGRRAITAGGGGWRIKHDGDLHVPDQRVYAKEKVNHVTLWDCDTGTALHQFTGHSDAVWGLAFGPGGDWFISASRDRTVRRWRLPSEAR